MSSWFHRWLHRWFLPSRLEDFFTSGPDEDDLELGLQESSDEDTSTPLITEVEVSSTTSSFHLTIVSSDPCDYSRVSINRPRSLNFLGSKIPHGRS